MSQVSDGVGELRRPTDTVAPGERGATRVADRVVSKIAAQAARETLSDQSEDTSPPRATVVIHHGAAHIRLHVELDYPCDIGVRCADVRRHVASRVGALVSMEVPEVAVHVERLHLTPAHGVAQGRTR
ncbi:Asp23/Gls24 family envelope stress response protein [Streptomyces guryensis]|uniref:Asp23/Gls24 family envelope stress response protein n=1 Tax=Streptomyces guryensis TaxID=2886947 RepID=A0A9Q3Z8V1_9ACTN|nr:Asp23/Gls24 family envelope stress response protein [Streptomyces guryensis]MCD9878998.1 Asp23/Gls24 family envelope stress response protein [Streptomyces guryensis]